MPDDNRTRVSITVSPELKAKLEELAKFPYKSVANAAVVLMQEGVNRREGREKLTRADILESLADKELDAFDLIEIAATALERVRSEVNDADMERPLLAKPPYREGELALLCWQKVVQGEVPTPPELIKLAAALDVDPCELKKKLTKLRELMANGT